MLIYMKATVISTVCSDVYKEGMLAKTSDKRAVNWLRSGMGNYIYLGARLSYFKVIKGCRALLKELYVRIKLLNIS